ncbi:hypothetical protein [Hazenella coriacea]|uniref:Uncharacterized protein n=1 Tax=Hazenella coriacea TaxID=1179467 RepID=A0A4R3L7G0_9BACL|nr:hypothetical protein [Hazenella coriacea]TCS93426.1 hypothetical protein EDD58_10773 [Hazenella coriacea]
MKGSVWWGLIFAITWTIISVFAFPTINFSQFPEILWTLIDFRYLLAILSMAISIGMCAKWIFKLYYRFKERRFFMRKEWKWLIWIIPFSCTWLLLWWKFTFHVSWISAVVIIKEIFHWKKKMSQFVHL